MNDKATWRDSKGECSDFGSDFALLTGKERRKVLETARAYWKLLKDNGALPARAETAAPPKEAGKRKGG